jgi:hypothetical protein
VHGGNDGLFVLALYDHVIAEPDQDAHSYRELLMLVRYNGRSGTCKSRSSWGQRTSVEEWLEKCAVVDADFGCNKVVQ